MWIKPKQQQGFVLPAVLLLGLVMLTSGLVLQAMAWQVFSSQQRQWQRDLAGDAAISKAMQRDLD